MKIVVAGRDRTPELGPELRRAAEAMARLAPRRQPARIPPELSALALARAGSEADYLAILLRLIRCRDAVSTLDFNIPRHPGPIGLVLARIKAFLWKLLRYQHDRIAFRQHLVNAQLTGALEFEVMARQKEIAELQRRLAELEKTGGRRGDRQFGSAAQSVG